jgi:hypothetical protein
MYEALGNDDLDFFKLKKASDEIDEIIEYGRAMRLDNFNDQGASDINSMLSGDQMY